MISFDDAIAILLAQIEPLPTVRLPLSGLLGSVLAQPVVATACIPRFDNSAMDGFGVRVCDVASASASPVQLRLQATIPAGKSAGDECLAHGCAIRLLTGAPVPPGVEAVVMREYCEETEEWILINRAVAPGENIRRAGEEFQPGNLAIPAGARITPPEIGLLATLGYQVFTVFRKPVVSVVVTGNELVSPGGPLKPGQIYDANSYALVAALTALGIEQVHVRYAADDPEMLTGQVSGALQEADFVITVGGVSVGDYDFVKVACADLGITTHFNRVAIKPGKPVYFGTLDGATRKQFVLGLPGNPVAALVTFQQFAKPALRKMMGERELTPLRLSATLDRALKKKAGRLEFVRGIAQQQGDRLVARSAEGQESHMLGGLAQANCLIHFPASATTLNSGQQVTVELLDWS